MQTLQVALKILAFLAVFGMIFSASVQLSFGNFLSVLKRTTLISRVFISNFLVIPIFTLGLCLVMKLPLAASTGMLLLSFAPYAPAVANIAQKSEADVGISVALTAIFSLLSILVIPFLCDNLLQALPESYPIEVDTQGIGKKLAISILLPVVSGMLAAEFFPRKSQLLAVWAGKFSRIVLPLLLITIIAARYETLRVINGRMLLAMLIAALVFSALGYVFSEDDEGTKRAASLGSQLRNPAIAIYIGTQNFGSLHVAPFIVTFFLMLLLVAMLRGKLWAAEPLRSKPA